MDKANVGTGLSWAFDTFRRNLLPFLALAAVVTVLELISQVTLRFSDGGMASAVAALLVSMGFLFLTEFATAVAGWDLGINPFDQPNVQEAKDATNAVLGEGASSIELPGVSVREAADEVLSGLAAPGFVAILAACMLAALSGSAVADTAALAALLLPMMVKAGHDKARSGGLIASAGIIAPVIPPSIGFVIFGVAANVSISKLFLAGIVPGILGAMCILVALYGLQMLPINYAGLALIALGLGCMAAEAFLPTFGALGVGGIIAFVLGAIMLIDTQTPGFGVPLPLIIGLAFVSLTVVLALSSLAVRARRRPIVTASAVVCASSRSRTRRSVSRPTTSRVRSASEAWASSIWRSSWIGCNRSTAWKRARASRRCRIARRSRERLRPPTGM